MKKIRSLLMGWSGVLTLILVAAAAEALERMPVERLDLQAKLLQAVIKFSSQQMERLSIGVIYVEEAKEIAQNFAAEIEKLTYNDHPIQIVFIEAMSLDARINSVNVVYVTPGTEPFLEAIAKVTAEKKILSFSGVPDYILKKKIALGFGESEGKPQIMLCLPVAKNANHDFKNPKFLNLQTTGKLVLIK